MQPQQPKVTIVVVPRERFSCTQASLESIYQHTKYPFQLVYVDGNSPKKIEIYLQNMSQEKGFKIIKTDHYLSPNHARNLGLASVDTEYVVFIDNDVIVSEGWLEALVDCAEATNADAVGPLMCEKEPIHQRIHFAGGECHIVTDVQGNRHIREKMYKQGQDVAAVLPYLQRCETELTEFHLILVRTSIFAKVGTFDDQMLNTKEHLDFCLSVRQAGGKVYFEPNSLATYVPGPPLELTDLHFFMLRWSDDWTMQSLNRFREKWNLYEDGYFKNKYRKLGWRRRITLVKPLSIRLGFGQENKPIKHLLYRLEKRLNQILTNRYYQRVLQP